MADFKELIRKELIPAMGCTEPIAIAYAAAKAREILGSIPTKITANLSSNIIKNANSVTVPSTNGRKGIEISVVAGMLLGDANKELEVLADVDKSKLDLCDKFIDEGLVIVNLQANKVGLYIQIILENDTESSSVTIEDSHTNIIEIKKNEDILFEKKMKIKKN